jgi:tripartite ATP-independent transporter DctM subunit
MGYLLCVFAVFTLLLGMPISLAMGVIGLSYLLANDFSLITIPQKIYTGMDSFLLLAIPFFLLAGALMNRGGVTRRLVNFAFALVGHVPGGLGHVTVVANLIMAGMSGTAAADAVATGTVLIPTMIRKNYSRGFAAAISACAAAIGPMVPPSVAFVIFGSLTSVSINQLFLGGILPGLLMGLYLMVAVFVVARRRGYGAGVPRAMLYEVRRTLLHALPAMVAPIIVVGGIVGGVVTATEAGAIAVLYTAILAIIYGEMSWRDISPMLTEVVLMTAVIYLMLGVFNILSWILAIEQIPQQATSFFLSFTDNWVVVLLIINVVLLICGMFMEPVPMMVLLGPTLMPVAIHYGIDPVHFGVMFVLNICIGIVHPPIGTNMFITCALAKCSIGQYTREAVPFLIALLLLLAVVTYIPAVTLTIPRLLG